MFDQPGTTRDLVSAVTALDGWPIELTDTAGLRKSDQSLEQEGIGRAQGGDAGRGSCVVGVRCDAGLVRRRRENGA